MMIGENRMNQLYKDFEYPYMDNTHLTNYMAYTTRRFNAAFTTDLQ